MTSATQNDDFYIIGKIIKVFDYVIAKSDSCVWNWKEKPMAFRQAIELQDMSKNPPPKPNFRVHMYGTYAKYFKELEPNEGEFLTFVNPEISPVWRFPEDTTHLNDYQLYIGPKLASKVCLHSEMFQVETKKVSDERVEEVLMIPPTTPTVSVPKSRKQIVREKRIYTNLKDCVPSRSTRYNAWAVITKINFFPRPTKRGDKNMAQVYIADPESSGSFDHPDYQFRQSLFSIKVDMLKKNLKSNRPHLKKIYNS